MLKRFFKMLESPKCEHQTCIIGICVIAGVLCVCAAIMIAAIKHHPSLILAGVCLVLGFMFGYLFVIFQSEKLYTMQQDLEVYHAQLDFAHSAVDAFKKANLRLAQSLDNERKKNDKMLPDINSGETKIIGMYDMYVIDNKQINN